jgi:hypothetical protein
MSMSKKIEKKTTKATKTMKKTTKATTTTLKNISELTNFIGKALPWMRDTGKARHLRKIEADVQSKGKAVIIWYGCTSASSVTKLKVTVNLGVHPYGFVADPAIIHDTENELKIAFACMYGAKQVKQQKVTVKAAEPVVVEEVKAVETVETVETVAVGG